MEDGEVEKVTRQSVREMRERQRDTEREKADMKNINTSVYLDRPTQNRASWREKQSQGKNAEI